MADARCCLQRWEPLPLLALPKAAILSDPELLQGYPRLFCARTRLVPAMKEEVTACMASSSAGVTPSTGQAGGIAWARAQAG